MLAKMIMLDWRAMKYSWYGLALLPVGTLLIGLFNPLFIIPVSVFFSLMYSINTFSAEEKGDLNSLYLTMPIKRTDVVKGRFALSFILVVLGLGLGWAMMQVVNFISVDLGVGFVGRALLDFRQYLALFAIAFFAVAFMSLFMFPFLFKLGYEKGKSLGMYVPLAILVIALFIDDIFRWQRGISLINHAMGNVAGNLPIIAVGLATAGMLLLWIAYILSVRIYRRRDF